MKHTDDDLIARLAADARPARPQRAHTGWLLLGAAAGVTLVIVLFEFGLRDMSRYRGAASWFFIGEVLLLAIGLSSARAAIRMAAPQHGERPVLALRMLTLAAAMPLAALIYAAASWSHIHEVTGPAIEWICGLWGSLSALLVIAVLTAWLRHGAPASPTRAAWLIGISGGALGSALYGLSCPADGIYHWGVQHFAPIAFCAGLTRAALPRWLRW